MCLFSLSFFIYINVHHSANMRIRRRKFESGRFNLIVFPIYSTLQQKKTNKRNDHHKYHHKIEPGKWFGVYLVIRVLS